MHDLTKASDDANRTGNVVSNDRRILCNTNTRIAASVTVLGSGLSNFCSNLIPVSPLESKIPGLTGVLDSNPSASGVERRRV